ncbi:MAG TPA: hypothetical protein VN887_09505 [Candidatus Angelobacter sp.]|nr:hypothetical protein [Candidatus Angelobacter sp.]
MKTTSLFCATGAILLLAAASNAAADDLEKMAGKWSAKKTTDEGQSYTQTIEIKKDKLVFRIAGSDGATRLYATGDVKVEKLGPFNIMKVTNIKAGQSEAEMNPVDDDRTLIYQLGDDTWTIASDFDRERRSPPSLAVYRRLEK